MITIEAGILARAMKNAAAVVESRSSIPILANVRLIAGDGALRLTTSDMDVQFEQAVPATVETPLATTVDARRLADIAGTVDQGAQVSLGIEDKRLRVKSGRARWLLPILPSDDFPEIAVEPFVHEVTLPGRRIGEAMARIAPVIGTEPTRPYLGGVFWHGAAGKCVVAATDGHRFVRLALEDVDHPADAPAVIMQRKFARQIEVLAKEMSSPVTLRWHEKLTRIEIGGEDGRDATITAKTVMGQFPDYPRFIPPLIEEPICLAPEALAAALRRIRVASNEKVRAVKLERMDGALRLSISSPDTGAAEEQVPAECKAGFHGGFNSAYLQDMIAAIGGETVEFHQQDAGSPALIRRVVSDGSMGLLFPYRI